MSRPELLRRARALRQEMRETGCLFTQCQFSEQLAQRCQDLLESAYEGFIAWGADRVDKESTQPVAANQPDLFDMGGDYKLGDGGRVGKSYATLDHMEAAMLIDDENLRNVQAVNARKHEELDRLRPYFATPQTRKADAVEAYRQANQSGAA